MIRHGGTEAGARRRGLHIVGVFGQDRSHHKQGGIINDAYTKDSKTHHRRLKTSRACYDAVKWGEGKSLQDMIDDGLERGSWE
tara:strand:+ start:289 stop:537 length:249 start_codon:yes stop_codon:yes gene_type:complete